MAMILQPPEILSRRNIQDLPNEILDMIVGELRAEDDERSSRYNYVQAFSARLYPDLRNLRPSGRILKQAADRALVSHLIIGERGTGQGINERQISETASDPRLRGQVRSLAIYAQRDALPRSVHYKNMIHLSATRREFWVSILNNFSGLEHIDFMFGDAGFSRAEPHGLDVVRFWRDVIAGLTQMRLISVRCVQTDQAPLLLTGPPGPINASLKLRLQKLTVVTHYAPFAPSFIQQTEPTLDLTWLDQCPQLKYLSICAVKANPMQGLRPRAVFDARRASKLETIKVQQLYIEPQGLADLIKHAKGSLKSVLLAHARLVWNRGTDETSMRQLLKPLFVCEQLTNLHLTQLSYRGILFDNLPKDDLYNHNSQWMWFTCLSGIQTPVMEDVEVLGRLIAQMHERCGSFYSSFTPEDLVDTMHYGANVTFSTASDRSIDTRRGPPFQIVKNPEIFKYLANRSEKLPFPKTPSDLSHVIPKFGINPRALLELFGLDHMSPQTGELLAMLKFVTHHDEGMQRLVPRPTWGVDSGKPQRDFLVSVWYAILPADFFANAHSETGGDNMVAALRLIVDND